MTENAIAKQDPIRDMFSKPAVMDGLKQVASRWLPADRLAKVVIATVSQDDKLRKCTPASILRATLVAAFQGLEPTGAVGGGYLVPRWNSKTGCMEASFQSDYRGELMRIRRAMPTERVMAEVVHENDDFEYEPSNLDDPIHHKIPRAGERGEPTHAWAKIRLTDGSLFFAVLTKSKIENEHRVKSDSWESKFSPWQNNPGEMWKKCAIRVACKLAPKGGEIPDDDEPPPVTLEGVFNESPTADPAPLELPSGTKSERMAKRLRDPSPKPEDDSDAPPMTIDLGAGPAEPAQ